ncbi:MAG: alpha-amylase family glycosyl hydrolase, partial [Gammaproteobacteria bacterium]
MMRQWAARSTYYHLMIDRFATARNRFHASGNRCDEKLLQGFLGGQIHGITQSLDYLQDLGVGILLLTPFFRGENYHGYWTTDFHQIDPRFGDSLQLRRLIKHAHQRHIRVILDLPVTHCHCNALYARRSRDHNNTGYRDWFYIDDNGHFTGFFGDPALPELNLETPQVRDFLKTVVDHWLPLGFDGIRFDHAKRPSPSFWQAFTGYLKSRYPQVFLLGENWHESGNVGTLSSYLHGELNIPLSNALRDFVCQPGPLTVRRIIRLVQNQRPLRQLGYLLPTFLDNHDMERISHLAKNNKSMIALAYLIQLTLPYPPIIYYGSERAQRQTTNLPAGHYGRDRYFREPMNWQAGNKFAQLVAFLVRYRNKYINWFMSEPDMMSIANNRVFICRYVYDDMAVTTYINFSQTQQELELPALPLDSTLGTNCLFQKRSNGTAQLKLPG